jgi:hemolysin III
MWSPRARAVLRRVDHSGIFLQIAGTFTPVAVLHAHGQWSPWLTVMWTGGALGMLFMVVFSNAPRALRTAIYVVLGLIALPVVLELPSLIGAWRVAGLLVGAAIYIIGAVVYARRWPNPDPRLFGYHEVFHVMVIVAAAMHFAVVVDLQRHLA